MRRAHTRVRRAVTVGDSDAGEGGQDVEGDDVVEPELLELHLPQVARTHARDHGADAVNWSVGRLLSDQRCP